MLLLNLYLHWIELIMQEYTIEVKLIYLTLLDYFLLILIYFVSHKQFLQTIAELLTLTF